MIYRRLLLLVLAVSYLHVYTDAWLLAQVGLNESYRVRHMSTHFSRVFLSITVESGTFPTLIEAQWPESYLPMHTMVYPYHEAHAKGNHSDCTNIQQACWSQVDSLSRLWVMDLGWHNNNISCAPKLLVYDLIRDNAEVLRIDCGHYIAPSVAETLVIKLGPRPKRCFRQQERHIYFILANEANILAYDIVEQHWRRRLLISRKYDSVAETFPVTPVDFAFGKYGELLVADNDGLLYAAAENFVADTGNSNAIDKNDDSVELQLLGQLLGPSSEMMVDERGALFYVVSKFGAVVRCEYRQNLTAEDNEIIYMTSKNIQQIFFGTKSSVWLLTDRLLRPQDQCLPGV